MAGQQTFRQLTQSSGYSEPSLKRYFYTYLSVAPTFLVRSSEAVNLLIATTYFSGDFSLVLYRDNTIKYTQIYRLIDGEWYKQLKEDLENLLVLSLRE